jgi:hypothetical protein
LDITNPFGAIVHRSRHRAGATNCYFPEKSFYDGGKIVHIEGTLTGDGIGYPNNHTVLTCYQDRRQCDATQIDSQGI